jgi:hypothetical protein
VIWMQNWSETNDVAVLGGARSFDNAFSRDLKYPPFITSLKLVKRTRVAAR